MKKEKYLKRISDAALQVALRSSGAVLIEGAKWCGKTRTAEQAAKSVLYMQDPDRATGYQKTADTTPSLLLEGVAPRLLDEWQTAPVLWDAVRFAVDRRGGTGHFILTGSAVPKDGAVLHTGTGRISRLQMRPMSLFESLESNGSVSLSELFCGEDVGAAANLSIKDIAFAIARGGWPEAVCSSQSVALRKAYDYIDAVIDFDISRIDNEKKDPARVRALLRSLARNIATSAGNATIQRDISDGISISDKTVAEYLRLLSRLFVVENLPAFSPKLRSRTTLLTSSKRHFADPSLAVAALRTSPEKLLADFESFGLLFESLAVRDLRIYAGANDGDLYHYCDRNGLEADAIIALHDGRWAAVEVKLGTKEIEQAAQNLLALKNNIDSEKMQPPAFLMVVTGGEYAYRREDGVYIVPLGCLRD